MIVYLVRHGETASNRDGVGLGRGDPPLTARGRTQVAGLASRLELPPARVYSSPLARCRETAAALAPAVEPLLRDELLELDVGETEGMPFDEMRRRFPDFLAAWAGPEGHRVRMPGGESIEDLALRLDPFVAELAALAEPAVAVVSHNFVTKVLLCRLLGAELPAQRGFGVDLASVSTLVLQPNGRSTVRSLNDRCHVETA